jgi:hypothetical protein
VGTANNSAAHEAMQSRIANSEWTTKQIAALSKLGCQVADRSVAGVLVELHNRRILQAGMAVVGTLAYMSWLNEYGAIAVIGAGARDVQLARRQTLKLATTVSFLSAMHATQLPFVLIPGVPNKNPSTSVKLPGAEGGRVEIFAPGPIVGEIVALPELDWHAQTVPFYDYLLEGSRTAAALAGGHCIPILLPDAARIIWHNLYSSTRLAADPAKAERDLVQAATLAAILIEQESVLLRESYREAPRELRNAAHSRLPRLEKLLAEHPLARDEFRKLR